MRGATRGNGEMGVPERGSQPLGDRHRSRLRPALPGSVDVGYAVVARTGPHRCRPGVGRPDQPRRASARGDGPAARRQRDRRRSRTGCTAPHRGPARVAHQHRGRALPRCLGCAGGVDPVRVRCRRGRAVRRCQTLRRGSPAGSRGCHSWRRHRLCRHRGRHLGLLAHPPAGHLDSDHPVVPVGTRHGPRPRSHRPGGAHGAGGPAHRCPVQPLGGRPGSGPTGRHARWHGTWARSAPISSRPSAAGEQRWCSAPHCFSGLSCRCP